jgi:polyisoprenoid-binding protein YceI
MLNLFSSLSCNNEKNLTCFDQSKRLHAMKIPPFSYPIPKNLLWLKVTVFVVMFLSLSGGLKAQVFKTDSGHAEVKGSNGMVDYTGVTKQLKGTVNLNTDSINFQLPLKTLKTGNSLRDDHMLSTLEAEKFPKAKFSGKIISDFPGAGESEKVTVKGSFTIHGQTKTIKVSGKVKRTAKLLKIKGAYPLKITEYGMERAGFWFTKINDKHTIKVNVTLNKE